MCNKCRFLSISSDLLSIGGISWKQFAEMSCVKLPGEKAAAGAAGSSGVVLWAQWVISSTGSIAELTWTGDWGSCLITTGMKGRLEEGGEAGGLGQGAAAAVSVTAGSSMEEGVCGSASTESIFSSFSLIWGAPSKPPVYKIHNKHLIPLFISVCSHW